MISSRLLKLNVFFWLLIWRFALWVLPFAWIFILLRKCVPHRKTPENLVNPDTTEALGKAVKELARYIPCATCLTQAAALFFLCSREGLRVELCLGVARDPDGSFHSHAWLRNSARVLIGDEDLLRYQIIYRLTTI